MVADPNEVYPIVVEIIIGQSIALFSSKLIIEEIMQEFHVRIGIDRSTSTYPKYKNAYKQMKRFIFAKY